MAGQILLKNPYMQDAILQYYPWHHFVFESFKNGILPLWNPYQMMGMPLMAGLKSMTFYPLNIFFIWGEIEKWHASIFLQVFLSMIFAYALCRDLKLSKGASIFAAVSFSLSSWMIGLLEFVSDSHAALWFPLFILFAKRFLDKKGGKNLFFLGLSIAFSIFAGQLQYTGYGLILLGFFVLYYGYIEKIKLKSFILISISVGLGIGISAMQLLPALEFFSNSYRGILHSHFIFSADLLNPNNLFRLFSPDFFGHPTQRNLTSGYIETSGYFGIISFFFALYAVFFARKNKFARFFSIVFVLAAILSLKGPAAQLLYLLKIPLITSGSGGRIFLLVMLSGSILAGFGLEEFLKRRARKNILSLLAFASLFGIGILLHYKRPLFFHDVKFSFLIFGVFAASALAFLVLRKIDKRITGLFVLFLIALLYFDLFRFGYRYLTFSNKKFLYPDTEITKTIKDNSRYNLARSFGITEPEIDTHMKLYSLETYAPFYPQRSAQLLQALQKLPTDKVPTDNKYYMTHNPNLKYALDFTGVSFVAGPKDFNPSYFYFNTTDFAPSFDKILSVSNSDLYINKDALPRFGLYYDYQVADSEKQLKILKDRSIDFRNKLLLEEELPIKLEFGTGSAKLLSNTINTQKFSIETDKPALFYISDTHFPGWSAEVNGKPTKIYRTNYNFRAALVPQGRSTIEFSYLPTHFVLGVKISIAALLLLTLLEFSKITNKLTKK